MLVIVGEPPEQVVFPDAAPEHTRSRAQQFGQLGVYHALVATLQVRAKVQPLYQTGVMLWG